MRCLPALVFCSLSCWASCSSADSPRVALWYINGVCSEIWWHPVYTKLTAFLQPDPDTYGRLHQLMLCLRLKGTCLLLFKMIIQVKMLGWLYLNVSCLRTKPNVFSPNTWTVIWNKHTPFNFMVLLIRTRVQVSLLLWPLMKGAAKRKQKDQQWIR